MQAIRTTCHDLAVSAKNRNVSALFRAARAEWECADIMQTEFAREQMVSQQVRAWDVLDERVLDTLRTVPRERFVPETYRELAFVDTEIPLAHGQHMLRSMLVGRLLQALELGSGDRVLEVGAGTGFVTACLARLGGSVRALEIFPDLTATALANLRSLGITNAELLSTDAMTLGEESKYDAIAVTGSLPIYDERFERALKPGGRLFVVVGEPPLMQAWLIRRTVAQTFSREVLFQTVIDALVNAPRPAPFSF